MHLSINKKLTDKYKSNSQKIRILSEAWVSNSIFCPACGSILNNFENNRPVADFYCLICKEEYELKSKKKSFGNKIVDGAYNTMIKRLQSNNVPNFFLLNYDSNDYAISNFYVIPKHFFVPEIIEQRKPLSSMAKRSGWVGCNILLKAIPQSGKIYFIKNHNAETKSEILNNWQRTLFLKDQKSLLAKGWILDIMRCIDSLGKKEFNLDEVYAFEKPLELKHPENKHVKDKIRQQLQLLRDKGFLKFIGRGKYKLL